MQIYQLENSKLGKIPNNPLVPGKDCDKKNCKFCIKQCYAMKFYRFRPSVKKSWDNASNLLRKDQKQYFDTFVQMFSKRKPEFFRIHTSGDFISKRHYNLWNQTIDTFPKTRYLAFTKSFSKIDVDTPDNFSQIISVFPGMTVPEHLWKLSFAFAGEIEDYKETDFYDRTKLAKVCPGYCSDCFFCWHAKDLGFDVRFPIH